MDVVEKIKTITYTACAAILTIVASICVFKLSNRACKVMDNFNGAIEGQLDKNGVPQDGLAGLVKKGNEVADGFKVVLNGEPDEQGALHGGLKDAVKNLNVVIEGQSDEQDVPRGGLKDMVNNLNDAIGGRLDENKQPYGVLPILQHVTKMVDDSKPVPGTIGGNLIVITENFAEVSGRLVQHGVWSGSRMDKEEAAKAQKKQEEKDQKAAEKDSKKSSGWSFWPKDKKSTD